MARSGLIWFASAGPQKVAYGIRATSAQEQDEIAKRVGLFAWESQIDGCYNARTGLLAVCFDGGEPLSAATQADLAKKLGKDVRRIPRDRAFASGEYLAIQLCPDEQE